MAFVQTMAVRAADGRALGELLDTWHEAEAGRAPGYQSSRLLADRDDPGRYVIVVHFSSVEEAERNNDRPETQAWAASLAALIDGEPEFGNFDELNTAG